MQRRDVLRLLAVGATIPVLPPTLLAHIQEAQDKVNRGNYALRTLSPAQNTQVVIMTDLIIPETDTPGAKGAKVNEFIDVVLTDWAHEDERQAFLKGLAGVNQQSKDLFGKDFVAASPEQQVTLLRSIDDAAMAKHQGSRAVRHNNTIPSERDHQLQGAFWDVFKGITVHGYYTSEIGFTKELGLEIMPGAYHGCAPLTEKKA
jgi:Gluconate 2-dehydrogenase subunit 3